MRYVLGIHLGASRVGAAVCRHRDGRWDPPDVVAVGGQTAWAESVLHVSAQGDLLVGPAALQHTATEPDRVTRAPLHRTGDPVPFVLGDSSYPAETLAAGMIGWVADRVAETHGCHAERIVVTHPPGWSTYRRDLLHEAFDAAELPGVLALPSPVAAAEYHLAYGQDRDIQPGRLLAVCAVGGVHVDTALLRRTPTGVELVSHDESAEHEAGCRLDDLIAEHVLPRTGTDRNDPFAMSRLRAVCTAAKERLSTATEAAVTEAVALSRTEFEGLARPVLGAAIERLRRLVARVPAEQLAGVLLVGGSARIPLATTLARATLSCPVLAGADPGTAACRGAALMALPGPRPNTAPMVEQGSAPRAGEIASAASGRPLVSGSEEAPEQDASLDEERPPPPQRPPVRLSPLIPPRRRFSLARKPARSRGGGR